MAFEPVDETLQITDRLEEPSWAEQEFEDAELGDLQLSKRPVELLPPAYFKDKAPITLWAIHIREQSPPPNEKPIEWFLLTTCEITDDTQAQLCAEAISSAMNSLAPGDLWVKGRASR